MKYVKIITLLVIVLISNGCKTTSVQSKDIPGPTGKTHQAIYALEHRYLPSYHLNSSGKFISDMKYDGGEYLRNMWNEIVQDSREKYLVTEVYVENLENYIVFITFPEPNEMVECFHSALVKVGENYRYITLEKTMDLSGQGTVSCFCEWVVGSHLNMGPRKYSDLESFKQEVVQTCFLKGE